MNATAGPENHETRFARGDYVVAMEPVQTQSGAWSVRFTVTRGASIVRGVDLAHEITFATRDEALAHGAQFVDELIRELGAG